MIDIGTAPHYLWGAGCDGWHLVRQPELSVIQERMLPGASELRHLHQHARQFFYVLSGELTMEIGGELLLLAAQQGVEIAPGVPHQALNRSDEDVAFLVISCPPSHGDRIPAGPPAENQA
ncbi:MAG: cupin domain-containing protein [Roseiflexaceae bacterium]